MASRRGKMVVSRLQVSRLTMFIDQSLENFCAKVLIAVIVRSFHATHDPGLPCTYTMHNPCHDTCIYRRPDRCVRSDGDAACHVPLTSRLRRRYGTSRQHVARANRVWPMWGYMWDGTR